MRGRASKIGIGLGLVVAAALFTAGCGPAANTGSPAPTTGKQAAATQPDGHSLGGWWCAEHGIPEAECSMCDPDVEKACKAKGDWCKEHNRAKSQCFICDPKLEAKFAAVYRSKEGKDPPKPKD